MSREFDKKVGLIIKNRRIERRMTQDQLADRLGIKQSTLSCYELGLRGMSIDMFFEVCKVLRLKPNDVQKMLG